ncbi:MAG: Holliday junction branch migration protein RuvA [Endomicrobiales bacterium]|nr:Holliday junction branch migration protein RuvA [Endomicrobiales bacterium]
MIDHIKGIIEKKTVECVVIEAGGVGYKVHVPVSTSQGLPPAGKEAKLFVFESVGIYSGGTTLYGFETEEKREIFVLLKEEVPGAGAKKALDYFDKVTKSLPDFRRCVVNKDVPSLTGIFGFTRKTAEKLIVSLKDKIGAVAVSGREKWASGPGTSPENDAVQGLVALGYRENQSREAVQKAVEAASGGKTVEELIKHSLRYLQ